MVRGEIWWADLPEPMGSMPGYRRPVLIIQADEYNVSRLRTVITVVLTANLRLAEMPGNMMLFAAETGLAKDSVANITQIATLDKHLLIEKCGQVNDDLMLSIEHGLRRVLAL